MAQKITDHMDEGRDKAADALRSTANILDENADNLPGGGTVADAAHRTARATGKTADYVRNTDVKGMLADAQDLVRQNPVPALVVAAALGFLVARAVLRD